GVALLLGQSRQRLVLAHGCLSAAFGRLPGDGVSPRWRGLARRHRRDGLLSARWRARFGGLGRFSQNVVSLALSSELVPNLGRRRFSKRLQGADRAAAPPSRPRLTPPGRMRPAPWRRLRP